MTSRAIGLSTALLLISTVCFGQTKQALNEKMASSTCNCLQQKLPAADQKPLTKDQAKNTIIQCFAATVGKDMNSVQKMYGVNAMNDKPLMAQLGRDMGALLLQNCPTFMTYSMIMADTENANQTSDSTTTGQTTGQWAALSSTGIPTLSLTVDKTQHADFAWLHHFPQDGDLLTQLAQLKGRRVKVSWQEIEVLQVDTRQYRKLREIIGVELL